VRFCFTGGTAHSALPALAKVARPKGLSDALLPKTPSVVLDFHTGTTY
jgi:hypothetical protein